MTIEFSLRRRATQSRCFAVLWLSLATLILLGTYFSLPAIADRTLRAISQIGQQAAATSSNAPIQEQQAKGTFQTQLFAVGTLTLGVLAVGFACFLLGRSAFVEIELSARLSGLADALCIAGQDLDQLEKATNLLVPSTKYLSVPEIFSVKDVKNLAEVLKQLRSS